MKKLVGEGKPFHSAVDKTAALLKRKVGTGAEFMKELMGVSGIKPTELQERGLTEIMGMPRMTHDQFMANLATRPAPKIREKVLSDEDEGEDDPSHLTSEERNYGPINQTHHRKWTLPGGNNYREMLIKAPKGVDNQEKIMELEAKLRHTPMFNSTPQQQADIAKYYNQIKDLKAQEAASPKPFLGVPTHFGGEPGILASMRLKDRIVPGDMGYTLVNMKSGNKSQRYNTVEEAKLAWQNMPESIRPMLSIEYMRGPDKKLLHLEELQSDWHQEGRKKGYKSNAPEEEVRKAYNAQGYNAVPFDELRPEDRAHEIKKFRERGVPDAPFKKNWEEMALKRLIHHAAEKGYHGVVITPGKEQAERYNIGDRIETVSYHPEIKQFRAVGKNGETVLHENNAEKDRIKNLIGEDAAKNLLSSNVDRHGFHTLSGLDLRTSDKGMKGFYDTKVPNILNSIGKKYGVKTELHGHPIEKEPANRVQIGEMTYEDPAKIAQLHHFPITEEMRKDVLTNGLPLYAEGGIIHKAEGGSMNTPDLAQSRFRTNQQSNPALMDNIGIDEALDMSPKSFVTPDPKTGGGLPVGGVDKVGGLPIGGVDQSPAPGMQFAPQAPQQPQQNAGAPQGGQPPSAGPSSPGQQPPSNILSLTPQGRALGAMAPQGMATGGSAKQKAQARFAMERQMAHLADGGQPPKHRTFAIQPANQAPKTEAQFTPYDPEKISIKNLARAFDEAIAHHLSLPHEDRIANSAKAAKIVGGYIGVNHEGKTKDLLGKNAKLLKTELGKDEEPIELPDGRGVETTGLALAPAYEEAGFNTCPNSASCKKECLGKTSGNYFKLGGGSDLSEFEGPRLNSLVKTQAFLHDPHAFAVRLHDEIQAAKDMAGANGNHLGVRLNVLSDINPRVHKAIIHAHPDVTFYDYTKNNTDPIAPNHHYTYSSTGASQEGVENENTNWKQMRRRLLKGDNVAMAFTHKKHLPEHVHDEETGQRFRVIDGDSHDFRPMDMQPEGSHGVIVGLKNKKATGEMNKAHIDSNGFFLHFDPQEKMTTNARGKPIYEREPAYGLTPSGRPRTATIATNKEVRIKPQSRDFAVATNDGAKNEKA